MSDQSFIFSDHPKMIIVKVIHYHLERVLVLWVNWSEQSSSFSFSGETVKVIPYHLESMEFGAELDGSEDFFQMFWPTIISHKIGKKFHFSCLFTNNFL